MVSNADWDWGPWVKARVQFLGLKLGHVADFVGTHQRNLSRWLSRSEPPNIDEARWRRLAKILKVKHWQLRAAHKHNAPDQPGEIWFGDQASAHTELAKTNDGKGLHFRHTESFWRDMLIRDIERVARDLSLSSLQHIWAQVKHLGEQEGIFDGDRETGDGLDRD